MNSILLSLFLSALSIMGCSTQKTNNSNTKVEAVEQKKETFPVDEYTEENKLGQYEQAIFAGGCFWCTEAAFERINGVVDVISGYAGGHKEYPGYYEVGKGTTGHTEAIYIYYDKSIVDYETLLNVLFVAHDPTTLNRQGPDVGEEYRSAIYYKTDEELQIINKVVEEVNNSGRYTNKIVTEIAPYDIFWVAEAYHQNYYELNPNQSYVASVSRPKVEKVMKTFPDLLKDKYKK